MSIFLCTYRPFMCLLWRNVCLNFLPLKFAYLSFYCWIEKFLIRYMTASVFIHSVGCPSTLLCPWSTEINFDEVQFVIFCCWLCFWHKPLSNPKSQSFMPMFYFEIFTVLAVAFRDFDPLWINFCISHKVYCAVLSRSVMSDSLLSHGL